jgi:phosphate-selective porin
VLIAPFAMLLMLADSPAPAVDPPSAVTAPAAEPQGGGTARAPQAPRLTWKEHPSVRGGKWLRVDFGMKVQEDKLNPGDDPGNFDDVRLSRARVGVDGELFQVLQFSVERELTSSGDVKLNAKSQKTPWRDVYGELKIADGLQIRGGRFKVPFSLDQLTGIANNDFVYRSLGATYLAPARDIGGMVHGRFFKRALNYSAGLFAHDGDNARATKLAGGDRTFAMRVSGTPLAVVKALNLDKAELGANFATTDVTDDSELPNGLRGRTVMSDYTFFNPVFVRGARNRYGADIDWSNHQVGGRAEYMAVTEARDGQGLRGDTLNAARARAYYLQGTWVLTGDKKDRPVEPRHPLPLGGVGAIEVAARYERLWFDSKATGEPAFSNSRAEVILPNGEKVLTLGVNWYVNRWVKLQLNGIHEDLQDAGRTPLLDGAVKFWSSVFRLQIAL